MDSLDKFIQSNHRWMGCLGTSTDAMYKLHLKGRAATTTREVMSSLHEINVALRVSQAEVGLKIEKTKAIFSNYLRSANLGLVMGTKNLVVLD